MTNSNEAKPTQPSKGGGIMEKQEYIELVSKKVRAIEQKRNWDSMPSSFKANAIKQAKDELRQFWTGNGYIKSRCLLAKAESFEDIYKAIEVSYDK